MNNIGTLVISPLRPQDENDTYPVAYANDIAGGWHAVQGVADRNAIPMERRILGMTVYVIDNDIFYTLRTGLTNADWSVTTFQGGSNITSLQGLSDVSISSLSDGDMLVYSISASKWQNVPKENVTDGGNY